MDQMFAFDDAVLKLRLFEYVTVYQYASASLLHRLPYCTCCVHAHHINILSRWESHWIWLLMLIIALLSLVALRFYSLRSPTTCQTSADQVQDNSNEAVATVRSSVCATGPNGEVSDNFGAFAEEFQNALRLKNAGDFAEAGKWHIISFVENASVVASFNRSFLQKDCCENLCVELHLPKKPRFETNFLHASSHQHYL
jgi:hypothetical protein